MYTIYLNIYCLTESYYILDFLNYVKDKMKRLHETYKLYRELLLLKALVFSIEELADSGVLPLELMPNLVHTYDDVVF